jgi:uncharacterized protein YjiS (DUF1127 family)
MPKGRSLVFDRWSGFWRRLQEWRLRAHARAELSRFSALELKDLGLNRGDIDAAIDGRMQR